MYFRRQPLNPVEGPVQPGIRKLPSEFKDAGKHWTVDTGRVLSEQESNPMNYSCVLAVGRDDNETQYGKKSFTPVVNKEFRPPYRDPDLQNPLCRIPRPTTQFINYSKYPNLYPMDLPAREYEKYINRKDAGNIIETPYIGTCTASGIGSETFANTEYAGEHQRSLPNSEYTVLPEIPVENFTYVDSQTDYELQENLPSVHNPYMGTESLYRKQNDEWSGIMTEVPDIESTPVSAGLDGLIYSSQIIPDSIGYTLIESDTIPVDSGIQSHYRPATSENNMTPKLIEPLKLGFLENSRKIPFSEAINNTLNGDSFIRSQIHTSYMNQSSSRDLKGSSLMSTANSSMNTNRRTETSKGHLSLRNIPTVSLSNRGFSEDSSTGKVRIT